MRCVSCLSALQICQKTTLCLRDVCHDSLLRGTPLNFPNIPEHTRYYNHTEAHDHDLQYAQTAVCLPLSIALQVTSAVDAVTELEIVEALKAANMNRTCIMVAHRLASVMDADRIYVMANGR